MNSVKLRINPYQSSNTISINDKPLSQYSELNNFIKEPFLRWGDVFFESVEREINDDFKLIVVSDQVDHYFIKKLAKINPSCIGYEHIGFELDLTIQERFDIVNRLAEKYRVDYRPTFKPINIWNNTLLKIGASEKIEVVAKKDAAMIVIEKDYQAAKALAKEKEIPLILYASEEEKIEKIGHSYLCNISSDEEVGLINQIVERFYYTEIIIELIHRLNECSEKLSNQDANQLKIAGEIDPFVYIDSVADVEVGAEIKLNFKTIPENNPLPLIRIKVLDESVVHVQDYCLVGIREGKTKIELYKNEEIIPFQCIQVSVYKNIYIQRIDLSVHKNILGIGMQQKINYKVYPSDAEDIEDLKWESSNKKVVKVSSKGVITAVGAGRCVISLSGKKAKKSINITVKPQAETIALDCDYYECYIGEKKNIGVSIEPSDVYNRGYRWTTTDKDVATIEMTEEERVCVRATGIGECTIYFETLDENASTQLDVQVKSTFEKQEYKHTWLRACALSFLAAIILGNLGGQIFWLAYMASLIGTLWCGIKAIKDKKSDWFWVMILIIMASLPLIVR